MISGRRTKTFARGCHARRCHQYWEVSFQPFKIRSWVCSLEGAWFSLFLSLSFCFVLFFYLVFRYRWLEIHFFWKFVVRVSIFFTLIFYSFINMRPIDSLISSILDYLSCLLSLVSYFNSFCSLSIWNWTICYYLSPFMSCFWQTIISGPFVILYITNFLLIMTDKHNFFKYSCLTHERVYFLCSFCLCFVMQHAGSLEGYVQSKVSSVAAQLMKRGW